MYAKSSFSCASIRAIVVYRPNEIVLIDRWWRVLAKVSSQLEPDSGDGFSPKLELNAWQEDSLGSSFSDQVETENGSMLATGVGFAKPIGAQTSSFTVTASSVTATFSGSLDLELSVPQWPDDYWDWSVSSSGESTMRLTFLVWGAPASYTISAFGGEGTQVEFEDYCFEDGGACPGEGSDDGTGLVSAGRTTLVAQVQHQVFRIGRQQGTGSSAASPSLTVSLSMVWPGGGASPPKVTVKR